MAEVPAFWLYEEGIGEDRALLIEQGRPAEIRIERHGALRVGDVIEVGLARILGRGRAVAVDDAGREYLAERIPADISEGRRVAVEVRREAIAERGRRKWPLVRLSDKPVARGPSLAERVAVEEVPVERVTPADVDRLAEHGWHELLDAARTREWSFDGGSIDISPTPAMTLIDVDGDLPPRQLALAAAPQVARIIRLFGLSGSIGVDFPTLEAKADRAAVAEAFDTEMALPCERTAVNGFGFMQIVMRRERVSLLELFRRAPAEGAMLDLLRRAERTRGTGRLTLRCHARLVDALTIESGLLAALERRLGREVAVEAYANARDIHAFDCVNEGESHG